MSRQKEAEVGTLFLLFSSYRMTSSILYCAQNHRQHYTLQEQFGASYMHNFDDKYPTRRDSNPVYIRVSSQNRTATVSVNEMSV